MKPFMRLATADVYLLGDMYSYDNMVRLTKWVSPCREDLEYIEKEYHRISNDRSRKCFIVFNIGKFALFVNDLTNGEFDKLGSDEEDDEPKKNTLYQN